MARHVILPSDVRNTSRDRICEAYAAGVATSTSKGSVEIYLSTDTEDSAVLFKVLLTECQIAVRRWGSKTT